MEIVVEGAPNVESIRIVLPAAGVNWGQALASGLITLGAGIVIFVVSFTLREALLEPPVNLRNAVRRTEETLGRYNDVINQPRSGDDRHFAANDALRDRASELRAGLQSIRWFSATRVVFFLPKETSLLLAADDLFQLGAGLIPPYPPKTLVPEIATRLFDLANVIRKSLNLSELHALEAASDPALRQ